MSTSTTAMLRPPQVGVQLIASDFPVPDFGP
jgi:hypothetical protein